MKQACNFAHTIVHYSNDDVNFVGATGVKMTLFNVASDTKKVVQFIPASYDSTSTPLVIGAQLRITYNPRYYYVERSGGSGFHPNGSIKVFVYEHRITVSTVLNHGSPETVILEIQSINDPDALGELISYYELYCPDATAGDARPSYSIIIGEAADNPGSVPNLVASYTATSPNSYLQWFIEPNPTILPMTSTMSRSAFNYSSNYYDLAESSVVTDELTGLFISA